MKKRLQWMIYTFWILLIALLVGVVLLVEFGLFLPGPEK